MLYRRRNHVFDRIGDRYGNFIDPDHFLGRNAFEESWMTQPAMNVRKAKDHFDLEIALPGYSKKNISVTVNNRVLEVLAEKNDVNNQEPDGEYIKKEIDTSKVNKVFHLSANIDVDHIDSSYEHGLLKIRLPKLADENSPKAIKVA